MAISRPFLLALLGAVLVGATFLAIQNARDTAAEDTAPAVQRATPDPQVAQPAAQTTSPRETLARAFAFDQIDSAAFDLKLAFSGQGERLTVEIGGAYERGAANDIPEFDVHGKLAAPGATLRGGFISLGEEAYFARGNTGWKVPDEVWGPLVDAVAQGSGARQPLALPFDPQTWVEDVQGKGTETIDGVETAHVAASIDAKRAMRDIAAVARRGGAEPSAVTQAGSAVKRANLNAWVGSDDDVVRRLSADLVFAGGGKVVFELELSDVNKPQDIAAPANVRSGLPGGQLGQLARGLVTGLSGLGPGEPVSVAALSSRKPQKAARAVRAGKKVVILFRNPRGLDDRTMTRVMGEVARRTNAVVLVDHVDAVERYGQLVEDVGVSQTPSVVLIDRAGEARLLEGYVDAETLTQAVTDAR
jgi:hypothetical protein